MDTSHIPVQRLTALLETFTLKHAARMLPDLLETADLQDSSCREFLLAVLETEVKGRNERRRKRNYSAAHFPPNIRPLEEFDPEELESGITQAQLTVLKELSWLDNCGNLVFAGPPGLGKTMVACGLGLQAVNSGYTVCFEKMTNLIRMFFASTFSSKMQIDFLKVAWGISPVLHFPLRHSFRCRRGAVAGIQSLLVTDM